MAAPSDQGAVPGADWQRALSAWLAAHKTYPDAARRRGEQGRVVVRFEVEPSGQVQDVAVLRGSGSAQLDEATAAMLRGARVPPPAPNPPADGITVTVTVRYTLSE